MRLRDVGMDYQGAVALHGVDMEVERGEFVALVGANGAGKSSLVKAISGLHRPVTGSIELDGKELSKMRAEHIAQLGVGVVPEGHRLFAHLTVERNLMLGAYHMRGRSLRQEALNYVFHLFPELSDRLRQSAGTLSGGEQQMLALGRALMGKPRLLILDEPLLGVAPRPVALIFKALTELNDSGTAILLIEQNVRAALRAASRGYVLQTGRVVIAGPSGQLAESEMVRRAYLGI